MKLKAPFNHYLSGEQTIDVFDAMCKCHDLTFAFSDCHDIWKNGHEELKIISEAAIKIGPEAANIWNKHVERKIAPQSRSIFFW